MLTTLLLYVHGEQYSNSFLTTWWEETHLETFAQVIGSHHHLCHSKVAVQLNSIWYCKLTSKQICGKLSEQKDWFKAKNSPKAEIRGTFRGPWATQLNILFSVREVKRSATTNHIIVAEPISQWQCTVLMQSFYQHNHTSPYKVVLQYYYILPRGQRIKTLTRGCGTAPSALSSVQMLHILQVIISDCQPIYIMHCNLIRQILVSV